MPACHPEQMEACGTSAGVESSDAKAQRTKETMHRENLLSLFNDFARFADDVAVVQRRGYRREKLTYAELEGRARFLSYFLAGHGISPGDRVLLWAPAPLAGLRAFGGF